MGCSQSIPEDHPSMFKAKNVDDRDKPKNTVILEVNNQKLIVHSKQKKMMASWPISCLHRYGFNDDLLLIETGHACDTGQGLFLFKCHRATQIFDKLKSVWGEIQDQHSRAMSIAYPHQMSVITGTTTVPATASYYNTTNSGSNGIPPMGMPSVSGMSHHPSTSNSHYTPPTPGTRGSASSHNTGLMDGGSDPSIPHTFMLQPAPVGRQEMLNRRRINSNVQFNRHNEAVVINHPRHHTVTADCEYENSDIIKEHKSQPLPAREAISYSTNRDRVVFHRDSPEISPRGVSANSLRSDGEHVPLTPVSNSTSGIGSLNGNSTTSEGKCNGGPSLVPTTTSCPQPPLPPVDPWRRQNGWVAKHQRKSHPRRFIHNDFMRLSPGMPMSARDYVNTANASMDVSGTPLPATAAAVGGANHFSFDFDRCPPASANPHAHFNGFTRDINYVPIEVSTKNGDFYSCGASSASSGLGPGTPLTPRTPGGHYNQSSCEYTEIDHHKTRALSDLRSRPRVRKSRHASSETAGLMNGL